MKKLKVILFALVLPFGLMLAQSPEDKGLQIAKDADKADQGFGSITATLTMILKNKHGQESKRDMSNKILELTTDGDKSMILFHSPKDVEGTATMTYTHKEGPDDQWLFLPSIKRVKRISSDNKSGPFMGSEFAFEDLSSQEVEKYTYKFLKEESLNGAKTLVVERFPVDPKSGYKRQIVWYNPGKGYQPAKIEFYDRKNALLKTLTYEGYQKYKGKFWRADKFIMTNHQTGKETTLLFKDYDFDANLADADFTQNSLRRAGR